MRLLQIKKKYPNAFEKFFNSQYCENYFHKIANIPILETDIRWHWKGITDFMDKQGIKIYAYPEIIGNQWEKEVGNG